MVVNWTEVNGSEVKGGLLWRVLMDGEVKW